jgi:hypothetical protein
MASLRNWRKKPSPLFSTAGSQLTSRARDARRTPISAMSMHALQVSFDLFQPLLLLFGPENRAAEASFDVDIQTSRRALQ